MKKFLNIFFVILAIVALFSGCFVLSDKTSYPDESSFDDNDDSYRHLYCRYDSTYNYETSSGALRIYLPTDVGYINYNIVHAIHNGINANNWRTGLAFACDDNLENEYVVTYTGEWDMAVRIQGRDDFIGGIAHGDEIYTSFFVFVDGNETDITSITELTTFEKIIIKENSIGYDPDDHITQVLNHYKEYLIDKNGISLNQKVEFLSDYTMSTSYLAMMPPLKTLTDTYYTDVDYTPAPITYGATLNATKAVVYGSNLTYVMSIPKYPSLTGGNRFLLQDNGGLPYNKMYFTVCNGQNVVAGDIWESSTMWQINNK